MSEGEIDSRELQSDENKRENAKQSIILCVQMLGETYCNHRQQTAACGREQSKKKKKERKAAAKL